MHTDFSLWRGFIALVPAIVLAPSSAKAEPHPWIWRHPLPHAGRVVAMVWAGNKALALEAGGALSHSRNGVDWHLTPFTSPEPLRPPLCWTGSQFLCAGLSRGLLTSGDGMTWTRLLTAEELPRAIASNGSTHVVVGRNGLILTSTDGSWSRQLPGVILRPGATAPDSLETVVWTGSQFVAGGGGARTEAIILTSPDGLTWTPHFPTGIGYVNALASHGTRFVALSSGATSPESTMWTSSDALSWEPISIPSWLPMPGPLFQVAWAGDRWLATGALDAPPFPERTGLTMVSHDGVQWQGLGSHRPIRAMAWTGSVLAGGGDGGFWRLEPGGWEPSTSGMVEGAFTCVVWTGQRLVAAGTQNFPVAFTSPDGITWTEQEILHPDDGGVYDMVWTGSRVIAIADWDSRCAMISLVSPDGLTWEMGFLGGNACLTRLAWNGNVVMAVGPGGEITTSPDGKYWTGLPSVTNAGTLTGVAWNGSQWVLSADAGVLTSPDASSWTLHPDPGGGAPPMMKAVHAIENKAIAVCDAMTAVVTGADPVPVWLPGGGPDALAWDGRYAVGVSGAGTRPGEPNSGLLEHSLDGLQWKLNEAEPLSTPLRDVVWTGTQFVAVGMHGAILTSGPPPEPRINLSGGELQLSWDRFSNLDLYGIESSYDLRTWTSVAPDINAESWSVPIDTLSSGRFLRVRAR